MAISFPLSLPSATAIAQMSFRAMSTVAQSESIFTKSRQTYVHQGEWWEIDFALPPMDRATAEPWVAFLVSLNGFEGTFLAGDPAGATARGIATGTPLVNGANQTGKTLATDGWTASQTGILKAGDWISLGSAGSTHLHKVVADANSGSGAGAASLEIWPRLRASPADNDAIAVASCKGLFRLSENRRAWSIGAASIYGLNFSAVEAL